MKHKFNIPDILTSAVGHKGLPFPGGIFPNRPTGGFTGEDFTAEWWSSPRQEFVKGTRLYKEDVLGGWYFMPVFIKHPALPSGKIELPHAILSITGSKTIVETPLVGRRGSVKELISTNDYKVSIAAFVCSKYGSYPAEEIAEIKSLFEINESVEIVSVLTDLVLEKGCRIVITDIDFPAMQGIEDGQTVTMEAVTDQDFELNII